MEGAGCVTSNKPFKFGANPGHDPDRGIFKWIFDIVVVAIVKM